MAKIIGNGVVTATMTFTVTEEEARALDALFGYSTEAFLKTFYEKMGKSYLEPHEKGLKSFISDIRQHISTFLYKTDKARKAFQLGK